MNLPIQKLSQDKRYSVSEQTGLNNIQETAKCYLDEVIYRNDEEDIISLYRYLDDYINPKDYDYVLNPFNTSVKKYTRFRGRLRNYNIIAPVVEMMLSEFGRRNHYPRVMQTHPDDPQEKKDAWEQVLLRYRTQNAINGLNEAGIQTQQPQQELPPLEKVKEDFERTYKENRLVSGQEALDYLIASKDLNDTYIDCYKDYLTCGRVVTYKGVNHDDVDFCRVHPADYYFPHSVNKERLEDRDWGIRKMFSTPSQFLDIHRKRISETLVKKIEEVTIGGGKDTMLHSPTGISYMSNDDFNNKYKHLYKGEENSIEHYHVVFKSFKRIAILTYVNEIGEIKSMEVEDNYKLDKANGDLEIEYEYKNCLYEAYYVELNSHKEWFGDREIIEDRAEVNNSSVVKLPFNGVATVTIDGEIKSLVKSGINYQVIFNILKYSFETTINKNKDKIAVIPLGLMNKGQQGWDEEKTMYYAEANSTLFIDETSPTAALALQGLKVLDMSLGKYVKEIYDQAQMVKQEWWDLVGFNRQRYGETLASDGKAVTEQAIFRSSLISENLIRKFEKFQEKDYAGLLDYSKIAWIDGTKGQYVTTDGAKKLFEINDENYHYYLSSDLDIHVAFSPEEETKIRYAQDYLFNATQNGMSIIPALDALDTKSFTKMREIIKKEQKAREELEQQNIEAERASNEQIAAQNLEAAKIASEDKRYVADKQYEGIVEAAMIRQQPSTNEAEELLKIVQTQNDIDTQQREQDRKDKELDSKIDKDKVEAETKRKQTETASEVATADVQKKKAETKNINKDTKLMKASPNKTNN